jgi:hypothetical protein
MRESIRESCLMISVFPCRIGSYDTSELVKLRYSGFGGGTTSFETVTSAEAEIVSTGIIGDSAS